jgi:hypothetical protein
MMPIFNSAATSLTLVIIQNMFVMEVGSGAQSVFEVEPGEDLHFIRHTGRLDMSTMHVWRLLSSIQRSICIFRGVWSPSRF